MINELPPIDEACERTVIASWFSSSKFRKAWKPEPELFFLRQHQEIAAVMRDLQNTDVTYDGVSLELKKRKRLEFVGGVDAVSRVVNETPYVLDPWKPLERLKELRGLRTLRTNLTSAFHAINSEARFSDAHAAVSAALSGAVGQVSSNVVTRKEIFKGVMDRVVLGKGDTGFLANCGIAPLDHATGGHRRRHVWVLGADTSWGKSSFVIADAEECFNQGKRVLIVSGEDEHSLYADRMMARRADLHAMRLRDRTLTDKEKSDVIAIAADQPDIPMFLDGVGRSAETVAGDIRSLCASDGIDVVFLDYVQAFNPAKKCENRAREVAYMARCFTDAIKMSNAAGVLCTQLTVDSTQTRPTRRNIRDSRDVAHGAEAVLLGYTDSEGNKKLYLDKAKDGPPRFDITMNWDKRSACFKPIKPNWENERDGKMAAAADDLADGLGEF